MTPSASVPLPPAGKKSFQLTLAYAATLGIGIAPILITAIADISPVNLQRGLVPFTTFLMMVVVIAAHFFARDRIAPNRMNRWFAIVVPFVVVLPLVWIFFFSRYVIRVDFEGGRGSALYVIGSRMLGSCPCVRHGFEIETCIEEVISTNPVKVSECYDRTELANRRAILAITYLLAMLSFAALLALLVLKIIWQRIHYAAVVEYRAAMELATENPRAFEKVVRGTNSLLEINVWLTRGSEITKRVCRIAIDNGGSLVACGSGFLVAADVVLTNYHVIEHYDAKRLRAQFDYYLRPDGSVPAGRIVELADDWLIASARYDPIDTKVHGLFEEPRSGNLDFALLRLASRVGDEDKRGWIDLGTTAPHAAINTPVYIVQHAAGRPMALAFDTNGVIGYSPQRLRVRYRTNTLKGSSGSPVFTQDWDLLALHHAGDPEYPELSTGGYNEGIPIRTLVQHLHETGILARFRDGGAGASTA